MEGIRVMYEEIQEILEAQGITYTEEQIQAFVKEAKNLVQSPLLTPQTFTDYQREYTGDTILTKYYPIMEDTLSVTINDISIVPVFVEVLSGIIHLDHTHNGVLKVEYTAGLSEEEVLSDITPLVTALILDNEGYNLSSITEGDVSVTYAGKIGSNGGSTSIDSLVTSLQSKYDCLVRLI